MKLKNAQTLYFIMPLKARKHLEKAAFDSGVTMSWIIRALIIEYRNVNPIPPAFKRPSKLKGSNVRFGLVLYGEKSELLNYARINGGEFSAFVRWLLAEWLEGRMNPDLERPETVKKVKMATFRFTGFASIKRQKAVFYKQAHYHPKRPNNNISLMLLGLSKLSAKWPVLVSGAS